MSHLWFWRAIGQKQRLKAWCCSFTVKRCSGNTLSALREHDSWCPGVAAVNHTRLHTGRTPVSAAVLLLSALCVRFAGYKNVGFLVINYFFSLTFMTVTYSFSARALTAIMEGDAQCCWCVVNPWTCHLVFSPSLDKRPVLQTTWCNHKARGMCGTQPVCVHVRPQWWKSASSAATMLMLWLKCVPGLWVSYFYETIIIFENVRRWKDFHMMNIWSIWWTYMEIFPISATSCCPASLVHSRHADNAI